MAPIRFYSWPTPNSFKVTIALREMGLDYDFELVDISTGEQFSENFLKKNPNNKIPVLEDEDGPQGEAITLFESGAILEYLADKTGKFLHPLGEAKRYEELQWLYWQMAGLGPMLGQSHHFSQYAPERIPYAIERYLSETRRLYSLLNWKLSKGKYVAGAEMSIADFACYPWIVSHKKQGMDLNDFSSLKAWFEAFSERDSVKAAYEEGSRLKEGRETVTDASRKILFGQSGDHLKKL